ncbi:MAG: DNA ligase [Rhodocyclaceae bacterium]|nr:DNA ligase [Rhodocyclaceae bacterium]
MNLVKFVVAVCLLFTLPAAAAEPLPLLLAERYQGGIDVSHYWVSEKLDGVRAHWDGKKLRFRSGNAIPAPRWFVEALPVRPLDGELWMERGTFERLSGIVRRETPDDAEWRQVRFMVFELPQAPGTFTERIGQMRRLLDRADVAWLKPVEQFRLADDKSLKRKLAEVVRGGGEGLMLHRADALYETGRSAALLKLTPWLDDEARVVAHLPGKGKYAGMTGALQVEMSDGRRFALGSGLTDAARRNPPPVGTRVTYRYRELTRNGIPRFARFLRVRDEF